MGEALCGLGVVLISCGAEAAVEGCGGGGGSLGMLVKFPLSTTIGSANTIQPIDELLLPLRGSDLRH